MGGVGTTKSLSSTHVSCEFISSSDTSVVIVNLGPSDTASFDILRTQSGGGGRTIASIDGFGAQAFSVSMNGVVRGFAVLTPGNALYSVTTTFSLSQDEALVRALEAVP